MPATSPIPTQSVIDDQLITAALWNAEFQNIYNLMTPSGVETYSDTDAKMQLATNPFPGSVTNHASSLAGELERIRYQIAQLTGNPFWYQPPNLSTTTIATILIPIGGIILACGSIESTKFFWCNGQAISRTTYATLFALIGTAYGVGDGTTTFNLPDLRDRFPLGVGGSIGPAFGNTGGATTETLSVSEMPLHTHVVTSVVTDPGHLHQKSLTHSSIAVDNTGSTRVDIYGTGDDVGSNTSTNPTGISVASTETSQGGGAAHSILNPYIALKFVVRVL